MDWPCTCLGGDWAIGSGRGIKDRVREAIQLLSGSDGIAEYTEYNHTGWCQIEGIDYYLHAGGAISPGPDFDPMDAGFLVDLTSTLPLYKLPDPPTGDQLRTAIAAVLRLRAIGKTGKPNVQGIAAAITSYPWRAVLGPCNFSVVLAGGSGGCKTSLACLAVQHFAPEHAYDAARQTPVTWEASQAAVEYLRHAAKDSLLVIDNFIADGSAARAQQAKAAAIYNSQGDLHGRDRMNADMTPKPGYPPRCGLLSTGEDVAARGSARGRCLTVQITKGPSDEESSIAPTSLTLYQTDAALGLYAQAMAGYIRHIARQGLGRAQARLKQLVTEYKTKAAGAQGHARTPAILGDLAAGYHLFLEWAETIGAVDSHVAAAQEHWEWLLTLAPAQAEQLEEADEALRWRDLLVSALNCRLAYIVGANGKPPSNYEAKCGWEPPAWDKGEWKHPNAIRIGWLDGEYLYLDDNVTMHVIQTLAEKHNTKLSDAVKRRLIEKGWLESSTQAGKTRYTVMSSIQLEGIRRRLLKIKHTHIWPHE